jgi:hypothetical protein
LPIVFGRLIEFLETKKGNPWPTLGLYVALWFLQSSGGLSALRETFWAPVMQYSDRGRSDSFICVVRVVIAPPQRCRSCPSITSSTSPLLGTRAGELERFYVLSTAVQRSTASLRYASSLLVLVLVQCSRTCQREVDPVRNHSNILGHYHRVGRVRCVFRMELGAHHRHYHHRLRYVHKNYCTRENRLY